MAATDVKVGDASVLVEVGVKEELKIREDIIAGAGAEVVDMNGGGGAMGVVADGAPHPAITPTRTDTSNISLTVL